MAKKRRCRPRSRTCFSPSAGYSKRGRRGGTGARTDWIVGHGDAMKMKRRLTRLEQKLPPPPQHETLRQKRWEKVWARFFQQFEQAAVLLSPQEEQAVEKALADLANDGWFTGNDLDEHGLCSPYICWLQHLQNGWSRLPKLPPTAMKEL